MTFWGNLIILVQTKASFQRQNPKSSHAGGGDPLQTSPAQAQRDSQMLMHFDHIHVFCRNRGTERTFTANKFIFIEFVPVGIELH